MLNMCLVTETLWDPKKHPRNRLGRFREVLAALSAGDKVRFPDGTSVKRTSTSGRWQFQVAPVGGSAALGKTEGFKGPNDAANAALNFSAQKTDPASIGGKVRYRTHGDAENSSKRPDTAKLRENPKLPGAPHPEDVAAKAAKARKAAKLPSRKDRAANEKAAGIKRKLEHLEDGERITFEPDIVVERKGDLFDVTIGGDKGPRSLKGVGRLQATELLSATV